MDLEGLAILGVLALVVLGSVVAVSLRRGRQRRDTAAYARNVEQKLHIPQSLHPVIDPDICIGSLSCIKACPEGDILGVIDGTARLVHATNCIGHGRCAAECPVGAIKLVFGTAERGVDLPELDGSFGSSRPGVHIVGELGGMGLIRNAITQGLECAEHLAQVIGPTARRGTLDVAVVGAGPAGLATALGCRSRGLSVTILEQSTLGGTVSHYPRQKVVMTETVELPLYGPFGKKLISKEELVAAFQRMVAKAKLTVLEGTRVLGLEGQDGAFHVRTSRGDLQARKVVLAIGRRGTPRRLGVPGEDLEKVAYSLYDPEQYGGTRVLVVGGGDSALEAAIQLARESDAAVAISYRGPAFGRCRPANKEKLDELVRAGRVQALMSSEVRSIEPERVTLVQEGEQVVLPNDFVIVSVGGELPLPFLETCGVSVRRVFGESAGPHVARGAARQAAEDRRRRNLARLLLVLGVAILASLAVVGWDYYLLSHEARRESAQHATLRPAGTWGHGVGIVATLFMLSNFLYAVRKRWGRLKSTGTIRTWLTFHMFVGFMSPLVIAFHAAFTSNNQLATLTYASLLVVVLTGVVGRYIYGLVPGAGGRREELADLLAQRERLMDHLLPLTEKVANPRIVGRVIAMVSGEDAGGSLLAALIRHPFESLALRARLLSLRRALANEAAYYDVRGDLFRLQRLRLEVRFYRNLKALLSGWRLFHAGLAGFLVLIITAHIALSLYLGFGWILF